MLKVVGIVGGILFILIAYMVFGGDSADKPNPDEDVSAVRSTPEVSQAPGTTELPPAYEEAVREANQQAVETAEATGGSVIPTPIARPSERIEAPVQVEENDPLSEWRREAETRRIERQQQEDAAKAAQEAAMAPPSLPTQPDAAALAAAQAAQNPPLPTVPSQEQVQAIAQQLMQQMQTAIEAQVPTETLMVSLSGLQPAYDIKKYFPEEGQTPGATTPNGQTPAGGQNATTQPQQQTQQPKPIIAAGTIAYAQIITEANSDVPGPVLAEVASGPLLGGRALGTFQVAQKHLVLQFNRVVKDGIEYPVQAFALDPATTLPGVVSEVNNHYFSRIFLPAASAFIEGFAEAATQKDTEVVVTNGTVVTDSNTDLDTGEELLKGAKEAGNKLSEVVDEDADRPRTVIVHAGTRIGLLFTNSVFDPNAQQNMYANQQQGGQQNLGQAVLNATPYGQAYNAYQAYQQQQGAYNNSNYQQQGQPQGLYTNSPTGRIQPF